MENPSVAQVGPNVTYRHGTAAVLVLEDLARVVHKHGGDLLVGDATLFQGGQDVVVDVQCQFGRATGTNLGSQSLKHIASCESTILSA